MTVDTAWRTLTQVQEAVRFADAKAGGQLTLAGVLAGFVIKAGLQTARSPLQVVALAVCILALVATIGSMLVALLAILPRSQETGEGSLIFFADIAGHYSLSRDFRVDFLALLERGDDAVIEQIADQVWRNSQIVTRKFLYVGWSTRALALGAPLALLALILRTGA